MKISKISYVVAIALALFAGIAVFLYQTTADQRAIADKEPVQVLVATADVNAGTSLGTAQSMALVKLDTFPISTVPAGAITEVNAANSNLVALRTISKGSIILSDAFGDQVVASSLIRVPDGKIAMAVNLGDPERVANFLVPGSEVVVFVSGSLGDGASTKVLFSRVQVLAIGATSTTSDNPGAAGPSSLVTLALDQNQAERLVQAVKIGSLYFGLLSPTTTITPDAGVTDASLF